MENLIAEFRYSIYREAIPISMEAAQKFMDAYEWKKYTPGILTL